MPCWTFLSEIFFRTNILHTPNRNVWSLYVLITTLITTLITILITIRINHYQGVLNSLPREFSLWSSCSIRSSSCCDRCYETTILQIAAWNENFTSETIQFHYLTGEKFWVDNRFCKEITKPAICMIVAECQSFFGW